MPEKKKAVSAAKASENIHAPQRKKTAVSSKSAPVRKKTVSAPGKKAPSGSVKKTVRTANKARKPASTPSRKASSGTRKSRRERREAAACWWSAPLLIVSLAVLIAAGMIVYARYEAYADYRSMRAEVDIDAFYPGTYIDGIDVSGMTSDEVRRYFIDTAEPSYSGRTVRINVGDDEYSYSCADLGYKSDADSVIGSAWTYARSGSLKTRSSLVRSLKRTPAAFPIERTMFDTGILRDVTESISRDHSTGAKDAYVTGFDTSSLAFTFAESGSGSYLDQDALYASVSETLMNGGGTVTAEPEEVSPETTVEDIRDNYGLITTARTNASSSSSNRLNNIKLALKAINGTCLKPGETFSFNGTVGQRTKARGYKSAPVFNSGEVTEGIGGGICQVSTTLFNAAMKADLEMVERNPHSRPVNYVDKGKDAAVDWPDQDMKFRNNTDDNIYIMTKLTGDQRIMIGIYGKKLDYTITIEAETVETKKAEVKYVLNPVMQSGQKTVVDEGRNGYKAVAYRVYSDADGKEIKRELLCKSTYRSAPKIVEYGP